MSHSKNQKNKRIEDKNEKKEFRNIKNEEEKASLMLKLIFVVNSSMEVRLQKMAKKSIENHFWITAKSHAYLYLMWAKRCTKWLWFVIKRFWYNINELNVMLPSKTIFKRNYNFRRNFENKALRIKWIC